MKIKINSDDYLPQKKRLELYNKGYNMVIFARFVFNEGNKYYHQLFLDECCLNYKS